MTATPHVYLAGPIAGCLEGEAKDWRFYADSLLSPYHVRGISPLRCEPAVDGKYDDAESGQFEDKMFGSHDAIVAKNWYDLNQCDATLAYLPPDYNLSIGTISEIAWAFAVRKPLVIVATDPKILNHPMTQVQAGWLLDNLEDACEVLGQILGSYAVGGAKV